MHLKSSHMYQYTCKCWFKINENKIEICYCKKEKADLHAIEMVYEFDEETGFLIDKDGNYLLDENG